MFIAHVGIRFTIVNVFLIIVIVWGRRMTDEGRMDRTRVSTMR
jgi:hypothetical protein